MSETEQAAGAVEEQEATAPGEPAAEAETDATAQDEADAGPDGADDAALDAAVEAAEEELAEEAIPVPVGPVVGQRQAKVFLCDRGHRTVSLWSQPSSCHSRPTRHGAECGRQLYPIGELPDQVQKALNPLKASKKASKG